MATAKKKSAAKKTARKKTPAKSKTSEKSLPGPAATAAASQVVTEDPTGGPVTEEKRLELSTSRMFPRWLAQHNLSLAFTTYQAHKLFFVGRKPDGRISFDERTLPCCMGLVINGDDLAVSSQNQMWRFRNLLQPGQAHDNYDRIYAPRFCHVTGDVDAMISLLRQTGRWCSSIPYLAAFPACPISTVSTWSGSRRSFLAWCPKTVAI